jgi:Zn-dependent protease
MPPILILALVALNLGLIYLLMAAPLGVRTVRRVVRIKAPRDRVWNALWPLGRDAGWSGEILSVVPVTGSADEVDITLSWEGRDGEPIRRVGRVEDVDEGRRFSMRFVDDTSLDPAFWSHYRESVELADETGGVSVVVTRTDRYRGLAFIVFRYFALRRELRKLKHWAETGAYRAGGLFERPSTQVGFAVLSALILWPLFGLTPVGLLLAFVLTAVVALHELGHMAAFRMMGHRKVRMIFIPLLGGIAVGGRPYDSRFEVAFVALMGAGFSAFLVPIAMASSGLAAAGGMARLSAALAAFAGCAALFNVANLVPVWKFDGGQVLRQISPNPIVLALASFSLLAAFLALGHAAGFPGRVLIVGGVVFALLGLITTGSAVKPRHELKPIGSFDRLAIAGALLAVFAIHSVGVLWAASRLI